MKQKTMNVVLGVILSLSMACGPVVAALPVMAEEETEVLVVEDSLGDEEEVVIDVEDDEDTEEAEEETETEEETEEETSDFIEGSALLSDYDYEEGEMTEDGWQCEYLNLMYIPEEDSGIYMGIDENEQLKEYHERNGKDKQVSVNEMVALDENDGYVQLMVEVNPNHESAEAILDRFTDNEELELISVARDFDIADRTFLARTGVNDSEKYMIAVCTEDNGLVLAVKVKYENTTARKALLAGFDVIEADEEESETDTEEETVDEEEFDEDEEIIEEDFDEDDDEEEFVDEDLLTVDEDEDED